MTTWFTSDQHFGHRNIIAYSARPFADLEEMHEALVARHNAVVAASDDVWHLGDFALDDRLVKVFLPRLNGRHFLVAGNHDKCHPCHSRWRREVDRYVRHGFHTVYTDGTELAGFTLNHLPYAASDENAREGRYPEFRPQDDGRWLLHGHVHELWKVRDRMINVGVDQWDFAPVSLETLKSLRSPQAPTPDRGK